MDIGHLNSLTPELVKYIEDSFTSGDENMALFLILNHQESVIAALHAGLRLKRELEGMTRE